MLREVREDITRKSVSQPIAEETGEFAIILLMKHKKDDSVKYYVICGSLVPKSNNVVIFQRYWFCE